MSWDLVGDDEYREYQEARAEEAELEHARRPLTALEVASRAIGNLHAVSDPMVVSQKVITAVVDAGFYVSRDDVERALHYLESDDAADIDAGIEILTFALGCGALRRVSFWRVREAVDDLVAENTSMRRLLGAYYVPLNAETNNVRPCTCILVRYQTHLEPEEWEQDPECDQHGDIRYVKTALAEAVDFLRRWRSTTIEPRGRTLTPDTDAFLAAHPEVPDA